MRVFLLFALTLLAVTLTACGGSEPECRFGAECASGACGADGRCVPAEDGGPDHDAGGGDDEGGDGDADADGDADPDGGSIVCAPDRDGVITRAEVPLAAGLHATFRVATDATVDTAGHDEAGVRHWDLSGELSGDHSTLIETLPLAGTWFGGDFPGASYAARLSDTQDLLGVFEITDDALLLRGVVSPDEGLFRTNLAYDPPVVVLSFPIERGDTWSTESTASGLSMGVFAIATESYVSEADVAGVLQTPFGEFPVQRVHVALTRTVGVIPTTIQSHLFVSECFGTVATIVSRDNESTVDFTRAAEVRRLAP